MGLQFDVYRNTSGKTREYHPYFMVIQHDYYDDLATRLIMPLGYHHHVRGATHTITPLINLDFQKLFLNSTAITHMDKNKLNGKDYVGNLRRNRGDVVAAIDALITNT